MATYTHADTQTHTHAPTRSEDVYWKYDDGDDDDDENDTYVHTLTDGCAKVPRRFF